MRDENDEFVLHEADELTVEEVKGTVSSMKDRKSFGPKRILIELLKYGTETSCFLSLAYISIYS